MHILLEFFCHPSSSYSFDMLLSGVLAVAWQKKMIDDVEAWKKPKSY
jgi:hypothetical protein